MYNPKSLIVELAGIIGYQYNLVSEIKNAKNNTIFTKNMLLLCLDKKWKYYEVFKSSNIVPFKIYKFDFTNDKEIIDFILKELNPNYYLQSKEEQEKYIAESLEIFKNYSIDEGLFLPIENEIRYILLNAKKYNELTILHEITHYFQHELCIEEEIIDLDFNNLDLSLLPFNMSLNEFKYLFSEKEFIPHIDDLCEQLLIIYNEYYKNISKTEFLNKFLNDIKDPDFIYTNDIYFKYNNKFYLNMSPLYLVITAYIFNINTKKIEEILKIDFN